MDPNRQAAIAAIDEAIARAQEEIDSLRKSRSILLEDKHLSGFQISASAVKKDQFAQLRGGLATREFLRQRGRPATEEEIVKGLQEGGWDGGTYPARAVALSVSNNDQNSKKRWFVRKGDLVYLTEWV
jgi:hypothetical protein